MGIALVPPGATNHHAQRTHFNRPRWDDYAGELPFRQSMPSGRPAGGPWLCRVGFKDALQALRFLPGARDNLVSALGTSGLDGPDGPQHPFPPTQLSTSCPGRCGK